MINRLKIQNKGLSQVSTTLILLIIGLMLALLVSYYATNITKSRSSQENVWVSKAHVWVNLTGTIVAFKVQNLGSLDVLIEQFLIRNIEVDPQSVYYCSIPLGTIINNDLNITSYNNLKGDSVLIDGRDYTKICPNLTLVPGEEILVYTKGPKCIQMDDIGTSCSLSVCTNNDRYLIETEIMSAINQWG